MSNIYYRVRYEGIFGGHGAPSEEWLYVCEHGSSDTTSIYYKNGEELLLYSDHDEKGQAIANIINNTVPEGDKVEGWDEDFYFRAKPAPRADKPAEMVIDRLIQCAKNRDVEAAHSEADRIVKEFLKARGFDDIADAWDRVDKYYA